MRFLALKSRELTQMVETPITTAAGSRWKALPLSGERQQSSSMAAVEPAVMRMKVRRPAL